jgi:hypothetical protein
MKHALIFFLFFTGLGIAQTNVTITDANFEEYLETHDKNGNVVALNAINSLGNGIANDHIIFKERLIGVTTLDITRLSISNLQGIEEFVSLITLDCSSNNLSSLDVSSNIALEYLNCSGTDIRSLDVSSNPALQTLYCSDVDNLNSLDVSFNPALKGLDCYSTPIDSLDISSNIALEFIYINSSTAISGLEEEELSIYAKN